jgi:Na+-transporting NADH:ubiquinone oxidoreductase subunit NqrB
MILQTAKAYAADLAKKPESGQIAAILAAASTAAFLLAAFVLWSDTGRSAWSLLIGIVLGAIALGGYTVSVLLRVQPRQGGGAPMAAE